MEKINTYNFNDNFNNNNKNNNDIKFILILGGSKFMGLHLLEELISYNNNNNNNKLFIFVINRGNFYWNGKFFSYLENNKDWIFHFKADRRNRKEFLLCLNLVFLKANELIKEKNLSSKEFIFDDIIDFTIFKPKDVFNLFDFLGFFKQKCFKSYIFISTDSTYNASDISLENSEEFFRNKYIVSQ
jgi:hypothetical protein